MTDQNNSISTESAAKLLTYEEVQVETCNAKDEIHAEVIRVRELKVREWSEAIRFIETDDDDGLTALAVNKPKDWVQTLMPSSYRLLIERVKARNADFFVVAEQRINRRMDRIAMMPPQTLNTLIDKTISQPQLPNSRLRPA